MPEDGAPDENRESQPQEAGAKASDASRKKPGDRTGRRVQAEGASRTPGLRKSQRRNNQRKLEVQPKAARGRGEGASWKLNRRHRPRRSGRRKPEAQPKAETEDTTLGAS